MYVNNNPVNVLLIEDDLRVAQLIEDMLLAVKDVKFQPESIGSLGPGLDRLKKGNIAVVLLDLSLPDSKGIDTFLKLYAQFPDVPIVILTGFDDEILAAKAVRQGAQDYLVKNQADIMVIGRAIRYAIERKKGEKELRSARNQLEERVKERTRELSEVNEKLRQEVKEHRKSQTALQAAYSELKEAQTHLIQAAKMQVVGRLASGVAHEVKNPLAVILQGIDYFQDKIDTSNENIDVTLQCMKKALLRADDIVKGLLDFASASRLELVRQNFNLIIRNSLLLLKHQFDKHKIRIIEDIGEDSVYVMADKNKMEQVFINILLNAVKAMSQGGTLKIKTYVDKISGVGLAIGSRKDDIFKPGDYVAVCEIEDTGTGIAEDILDKVFDPFFTTTHGSGGTGLGLSIVKNIVQMHKGKIEIDNKKDGGVKVSVILGVVS